MRGRNTAFIFKSVLSSRNPVVITTRSFSYDPLQGFEPWNPASPTSPLNPANPLYYEMIKQSEAKSTATKKEKPAPTPKPSADDKQDSSDKLALRLGADY